MLLQSARLRLFFGMAGATRPGNGGRRGRSEEGPSPASQRFIFPLPARTDQGRTRPTILAPILFQIGSDLYESRSPALSFDGPPADVATRASATASEFVESRTVISCIATLFRPPQVSSAVDGPRNPLNRSQKLRTMSNTAKGESNHHRFTTFENPGLMM